jgi:lysophospholipase L1-like esterase
MLAKVRGKVSWSAALLIAEAVAVTIFGGYLVATWPPDPPAEPVSMPQARNTGAGSGAGSGTASASDETTMVVLGDSISVESAVSEGPEWPQLLARSLDWEVFPEAVDRSGYVSPGTGEPFPARVDQVLEHDADVIIVAGGVGDVGPVPNDQIASAAEDVLSRLVEESSSESEVVVLSPFSNGEPGPLTAEFDASLREIAQEHDLPYVDATEWLPAGQGYFGPDIYHPTDEGQRQVAERMEEALAELGLADAGEGNGG